MEQISPAQLTDWAKGQTQRPVLLDVREGWEVQTASAKTDALDLVHMPMQTIPARLDELDKSRPIACLCHHGGRSMQVAAFFATAWLPGGQRLGRHPRLVCPSRPDHPGVLNRLASLNF